MVLIEKDGWTLIHYKDKEELQVSHFCDSANHNRIRRFSAGWKKCFACGSLIPDLISVTAELIDPQISRRTYGYG